MAAERKRYRAFISYSQTDMAPAQRLHRALENYRVPLGIAPDVIGRKDRRLGRFFRDMDEMGAATDISATVRAAIDDSESLIVVCSPRSAKSKWVQAEIDHFRRTGRGDHIYAVIVDGSPNSGDPETECFPPGLRAGHREGDMPVEPVGIDLRKESLPRACTRIAAGLLDIPFDDLWQRARRETRRRMMLAGGVAAGAALIAAGVVTAIWSAGAREAGRARSLQLAEAARAASDTGAYDRAARYALAGLKGAEDWLTGFAARDAELELRRALAGGLEWVVRTGFAPPPAITDEPAFYAADLSADGTLILTAGSDGAAQLRDAATGRVRSVIDGYEGPVFGLIAPDAGRVLTYGPKGPAHLRDAAGAVVATLQGREGQVDMELSQPQFSADGARLAAIVDGNVATVWDGRTGERLVSVADDQMYALLGLWLAADGSRITGWEASGQLTRWDAASGRTLASIALPGPVDAVEVGPDGQSFIAYSPPRNASGTLAIMLHDGAGRRTATVSLGQMIPVSDDFSPDGQRIMAGTMDGHVVVFDIASREQWQWKAHDGAVEAQFSADGLAVLTYAYDEAPRLWSLDGLPLAVMPGGAAVADRVDISADGRRVLTAMRDGALRLWTPPAGATDIVVAAGDPVFSPDGRTFAAGTEQGVGLWSLADGRAVAAARIDDAIADIAFSPDGARLMGSGEGIGARVWEAASGAAVAGAGAPGGTLIASAWTVNGPRVMTWAKEGPVIWNVAENRVQARLDGRPGRARFSPDGTTIATMAVAADGLEDPGAVDAGNIVRLFEVETGRPGPVLRGHTREVFDVAFSPDSRRIATASQDQTLRIWTAATGQEERVFAEASILSSDLAFSPDGRQVAMATVDSVIQLFDVVTGARIVLSKHDGVVMSVQFSADSTRLLSASMDGTVRLWDVASGRELLRLRQPDVVLAAGFAPDGRIWRSIDRMPLRIGALPAALAATRIELVRAACGRLLAGGATRLAPEELKLVPQLDAAREAEVCR